MTKRHASLLVLWCIVALQYVSASIMTFSISGNIDEPYFFGRKNMFQQKARGVPRRAPGNGDSYVRGSLSLTVGPNDREGYISLLILPSGASVGGLLPDTQEYATCCSDVVNSDKYDIECRDDKVPVTFTTLDDDNSAIAEHIIRYDMFVSSSTTPQHLSYDLTRYDFDYTSEYNYFLTSCISPEAQFTGTFTLENMNPFGYLPLEWLGAYEFYQGFLVTYAMLCIGIIYLIYRSLRGPSTRQRRGGRRGRQDRAVAFFMRTVSPDGTVRPIHYAMLGLFVTGLFEICVWMDFLNTMEMSGSVSTSGFLLVGLVYALRLSMFYTLVILISKGFLITNQPVDAKYGATLFAVLFMLSFFAQMASLNNNFHFGGGHTCFANYPFGNATLALIFFECGLRLRMSSEATIKNLQNLQNEIPKKRMLKMIGSNLGLQAILMGFLKLTFIAFGHMSFHEYEMESFLMHGINECFFLLQIGVIVFMWAPSAKNSKVWFYQKQSRSAGGRRLRSMSGYSSSDSSSDDDSDYSDSDNDTMTGVDKQA